METIKLVAIFLLIVFALRKHVSVGVTLLLAGFATAALYSVEMGKLFDGYLTLVQSHRFIFLTSVVLLVTFLGALLKEMHYLDRMSEACRQLWGGKRTAAATLPPLIGLMPMPGGSLLSAPLVDKVLTGDKYPPEFRTALNYWMRHIVEFFWPVYPGIILTEAITGMPISQVSLMQFPMAVFMVLIGVFFFVRHVEPGECNGSNMLVALKGIISSIWPIVLAIVVYVILDIDLAWAVLASTLLLIITARPSADKLLRAAKHGFSWKLVLLVFGTLSFQTVLELSGAIESIPRLAASLNLPAELVIFAVCFIAGLLTGMVAAYIAMGYTILAGFLYQPVIVPEYILLAYLSGYVGIMLSPTHLCLILTNEYFGSDLGKVYKQLVVPIVILALGGFALYLSGWSEMFMQ